MRARLAMATVLLLIAGVGHAQEAPPLDLPAGMEAIAREMEFDQPTRIAGRLMTVDTYDDAIWIEWTEVFADGRWQPVPPERQFILYPAHPAMMQMFRMMPKGTILRMTVRRDPDGKRKVVELEGI